MRAAGGWLLAACLLAACHAPKLSSENPYERHLAVKRADDLDLKAALHDPDWRVAATACGQAAKGGRAAVAAAAAEMLAQRTHDDERLEHLLRLVGHAGGSSQAPVIAKYLGHQRPSVRMAALLALAIDRAGRPGMEPLIGQRAEDEDPRIRRAALRILGDYPTRLARIVAARKAGQWTELTRLGEIQSLLQALETAKPKQRLAILSAVRKAGAAAAAPVLAAILDTPALGDLHLEAFAAVSASAAGRAAFSAKKGHIVRRWRERVTRAVEGCATPAWYRPFAQLKAWASQPKYSFLAPLLQQGLARCRARALKRVRREADDACPDAGCDEGTARQ